MAEQYPNGPVQPTYDPAAAPPTVAGYPQPVMTPQQLAAQQAALQAMAAQQAMAAPPVAPAPAPPATEEVHSEPVKKQVREEIRLYSHSPLVYWWPVWLVGFIMAGLSHWGGQPAELAQDIRSTFYPSATLGVAFLLTLYFVILVSNVAVRGLASALVIVSAVLVVVTISYLRLWDPILYWFAGLNVYLNAGAYFWFSLLMFITWFVTVFVVDHMSYWTIKPGQVTENFVLGASSRSYDTQNITIEKFRSDLFRHWVLGLGAGDLKIETQGAQRETIFLPNVFFIGSRIHEIQNLIATRPTEFGSPTLK